MKFILFFLGSENMDEETKNKVNHLIELLNKIWKYIHNWYETRNLLELP